MTMRKVVIHSAGGYDKLCVEEQPIPDCGADQVLIETRACGVNFADCCVRMGVYRSAQVYVGWPITPGFEVSGVVTAVGENVWNISVGQAVVAVTRFGGYTSHLVVPENQVFPMPSKLSFIEAAGFPAVFLTAYYAMFELAHPRKGDKVLVHSAAGGVGGALVQLAHVADCHPVGVVGASHKVEFLKKYEPVDIIDKSKDPLWKRAEELSPEGYAVIFDANGVATLRDSYRHLASGGKLVVYGFHTMLSKGRGKPNWIKVIWDYLRTPRFNPMDMTTDNHSVLAFNLSYLFDQIDIFRKSMGQIIDWIDQGLITPPAVRDFPLEHVADAHRELESGQSTGKLVLTI